MSDVSFKSGPPRLAFGSAAKSYVARLPADLEIIVADHAHATRALAAAVERRRQGSPFFVAPLVEDERAAAALAISGALYSEAPHTDDRRARFDLVADDRCYAAITARSDDHRAQTADDIDERARVVLGLSASSAGTQQIVDALRKRLGIERNLICDQPMSEPQRRVLRDFAITGDALLVRSQREADRVAVVLGRRRPFTAVAPGCDRSVPAVMGSTSEPPAIVVWAPLLDASSLGVIATALDGFKTEIVYVCASGSLPQPRASFVRPSNGADALGRACCVIDASAHDPAAAISLARLGLPMVVSTTSGAGEFMTGAHQYDPWNWRTITAAVAIARGQAGCARVADDVTRETLTAVLRASEPQRVYPEPLVSVLIPTYNRPHMLNVALASIARQSYKNVEAIVVNNGSASVAEVTANYPFVRLIENTQNVGVPAFFVQAMAQMNGTYFCALADDDIDFPHFLTKLVGALERTGASVAHGNTVTRYFADAAGVDRSIAYRVRSDRGLDTLTIRCGATMTFQSMLFRTSLLKKIGGMDASLGPCDLDFQIRAAAQVDFVHVDEVVCCWNSGIEPASFNTSDELANGLMTLYERYPADGSLLLERMRERELARFANRGAAPLWAPDLELSPVSDRHVAVLPETA